MVMNCAYVPFSSTRQINLVGHCLARVNKDLVIEELSVHFDRCVVYTLAFSNHRRHPVGRPCTREADVRR